LKILKNKTAAIAIAIFFILSMAGSMLAAPAKAQITAVPGLNPPSYIPTFLYIIVGPNPIGVGQQVNLNVFMGNCLPDTEIPCFSDPQNFNVTVTTPSGTSTTLTLAADKTGGGHADYVPASVGTYKVQGFYGGQPLDVPGWVGLYKEAAVTPVVTLTVQQAPVTFQSYPATPLPTRWWETPVTAENVQNWYKLMGPALYRNTYNTTSYCNPYTAPVLSAHIIWTKPWTAGGVIGGDAGGGETNGAWWTVRQYEQPFNPIMIDGKMWAQWYPQVTSSSYGIVCVDLFTGATLYRLNTTSTLYCGMATDWSNGNMYGGLPYVIWTTGALPPAETGGHLIPNSGTQYNMYDGLTGEYILTIVNGSGLSGLHTDNMGNLVGYYTNSTIGTMTTWNSFPFNLLLANGTSIPRTPTINKRITIAANPYAPAGTPSSSAGLPQICQFNFTQALWDTAGTSGGIMVAVNTIIDFRLGVQWAAPLPLTLNGGYINASLAFSKYTGNELIYTSYMQPGFFWQDGWMIIAAFSPTDGHQLWIENLTYPTTDTLIPWARGSWFQGLYAQDTYMILSYHSWAIDAFSCDTGSLLWKNSLKTNWGNGAPNLYDEVAESVSASCNIDGQFVIATFGGDIWDVNVTNGNTIWYTNTTNLIGPSGIETPYNTWPLWAAFSSMLLDHGCFYAAVGHCYNPPLFHGAQLIAINMTNGNLVWKFLDFPVMINAEAYGTLLSYNCYDGQVYAFNKGPSAVTVTAPDVGVTTDTPIRITGTVMDVSAGTTQEQQKFDFPNGVPCVSDASESAFMEYVYENQPAPTNTTGVQVTLTETDHNGNTYTIGTTTSDALGDWGITWTPPIPGDYQITATFAGSNSYYGSAASTSMTATAAVATTVATTAPVQSFATTSDLMLGIAAVIVVIIIIGAVLAVLMMRKRP